VLQDGPYSFDWHGLTDLTRSPYASGMEGKNPRIFPCPSLHGSLSGYSPKTGRSEPQQHDYLTYDYAMRRLPRRAVDGCIPDVRREAHAQFALPCLGRAVLGPLTAELTQLFTPDKG